MDFIIDIINNPTVIHWIAYGLTALIVFLAMKWLKLKIDAKKLVPIVEKIINWILEQSTQDNKTGSEKHNAVTSMINQLPQKELKTAKKLLGSDPVQKVYETVTKDIPKGQKSNIWQQFAIGAGKTAIGVLAGGLAKKIF